MTYIIAICVIVQAKNLVGLNEVRRWRRRYPSPSRHRHEK
jgi:hypothetical protein